MQEKGPSRADGETATVAQQSGNTGAAATGGGLRLARNDLALALLALLFVVVPLYRAPILEDSFLSPKLLLIQLGCLVVLLTLLFRRGPVSGGAAADLGNGSTLTPAESSMHGQDAGANVEASSDQRERGSGLVAVMLAAFVLVHVPSFWYAPSRAMVLTALVYFTSFLLLHMVCRMALRGTRPVQLIFNCGLVAAITTAAWTIYEDAARLVGWTSVVARLPDWRGYLSAGLGNSGHIAGFMGLFLPWGLLAYLTSERWRPGVFIGLLLMAGAFVVTWSVGSSGATILSILLWTIVVLWSPFRALLRWRRMLPLLAGTALVASFYLLPHPLNPHQPSLWHEAFGSQRWAEGWPTRLVIWKTSWHMVTENPLLGVGAGNFTREYVRQVVPGVLSDPQLRIYAGAFTNDAHNEYLQVWSEGGLAALICFLGIFVAWGASATAAIRRLKLRPLSPHSAERFWLMTAAGAGITVFLLDSLMTFPVRLPAHFAALMFFLAVPAALRHMRSVSTGTPAGKSVVICLLVIASLCIVVHFRRVAAEYYLKQGRTVVESSPIFFAGQPMGVWHAADSLLNAGIQQLAEGNRSGAEAYFAQARELSESEPFDLARQAFQAAWKWDSNYTNSTSRYAQLELMQGNYEAARMLLKETLKHLQASDVLERLGVAELMLGNREAAVEAWQEAGRRRPLQSERYEGLIRQAQQ